MAPSWISKKGVGRKHAMLHKLTPEENFLRLLVEFAADDPMLERALWTNLSHCEISRRLA